MWGYCIYFIVTYEKFSFDWFIIIIILESCGWRDFYLLMRSPLWRNSLWSDVLTARACESFPQTGGMCRQGLCHYLCLSRPQRCLLPCLVNEGLFCVNSGQHMFPVCRWLCKFKLAFVHAACTPSKTFLSSRHLSGMVLPLSICLWGVINVPFFNFSLKSSLQHNDSAGIMSPFIFAMHFLQGLCFLPKAAIMLIALCFYQRTKTMALWSSVFAEFLGCGFRSPLGHWLVVSRFQEKICKLAKLLCQLNCSKTYLAVSEHPRTFSQWKLDVLVILVTLCWLKARSYFWIPGWIPLLLESITENNFLTECYSSYATAYFHIVFSKWTQNVK